LGGVAVMGLDPQEQRSLKSIGERLSGSDPGLASLLATFTRLTSAEEMPAREEIRPGGGRHGIRARSLRRSAAGQPRRGDRPWVLKQIGLAVSLAMALGLIAIALVVSSGARTGSCTGRARASCLGCSAAARAYSCFPLAHGIITTP
jgi:hypothetical protein